MLYYSHLKEGGASLPEAGVLTRDWTAFSTDSKPNEKHVNTRVSAVAPLLNVLG